MMERLFATSAPGTVRAAAGFVIAGSLLEAVFSVRHHWPDEFTFLETWQAVMTPLSSVLTGFVLAFLIGRLVVWGYWLLVLLWVPLMFLGTGTFLWQMAVRDGAALPDDPWFVLTLAALGCYLAACALLLSGPSRRAIRQHGRKWW